MPVIGWIITIVVIAKLLFFGYLGLLIYGERYAEKHYGVSAVDKYYEERRES